MIEKIQFDSSKAKTYRKRTEVLAFQSEDAVTFFKPWGELKLRPDGWLVVQLTDEGKLTQNIYGVDDQVFDKTYVPSDSGNPYQYRKKETIQAYQPGAPFRLDTIMKDGFVEVEGSRGESADTWLVQGPDGEIYPIEDNAFKENYIEVSEKQ